MSADVSKPFHPVTGKYARVDWAQLRADWVAGKTKKELQAYGPTLAFINQVAAKYVWNARARGAAVAERIKRQNDKGYEAILLAQANSVNSAKSSKVAPVVDLTALTPLPEDSGPVLDRMATATSYLVDVIQVASRVAKETAGKGLKEAAASLAVAQLAANVLESLGKTYASIRGIPVQGSQTPGVVMNFGSVPGSPPGVIPPGMNAEVVELMNVVAQSQNTEGEVHP